MLKAEMQNWGLRQAQTDSVNLIGEGYRIWKGLRQAQTDSVIYFVTLSLLKFMLILKRRKRIFLVT